ncbi:MAG: class I SAM-dependent methyltransferase [Egibacteraceae bacterium]
MGEAGRTASLDAFRCWDDALAGWAIPEELLAAAPESPYGFGVGLFDRLAGEAMRKETPSRRCAREALPDGGTVLDVGCGGGAASLSLGHQIGRVIGVDQQAGMLQAFAARAERLGVAHEQVLGRWPDVAGDTPATDLVVCHHVLYNVGALEPFVRALTAHARRRVVVEMTAEHPLAWLRPLWQRLHGLDRPTRPTVDDAVTALQELGLAVELERWDEPSPWKEFGDEVTAFVRRRLCLAAERGPDIRAALIDLGLPHERRLMTTLWWPPTAS